LDIGVIGLGRMGAVIARRLVDGGHRVVGHDLDRAAVAGLDGVVPADSLAALVEQLRPPRAVWVMLPAGPPTQEMIDSLGHVLSRGDVIVDGGNSFYGDSVRQAARLAAAGIEFVDVGVSGGVWGVRDGYGVLVGGEERVVGLVMPALEAVAAVDGLALLGVAGSGHFAKMVHNAVEYAVLEAYAEGYEVLAAGDLELDTQAAVRVWGSACSIRSFLLEKMADALQRDPEFSSVQGWVDDSGMGRWTIADTVRLGVPAPALTAALQARFRSRQEDSPAMKAIAATRREVGGHAVKSNA
jgi:6-phosphogluconate dehydrogenase